MAVKKKKASGPVKTGKVAAGKSPRAAKAAPSKKVKVPAAKKGSSKPAATKPAAAKNMKVAKGSAAPKTLKAPAKKAAGTHEQIRDRMTDLKKTLLAKRAEIVKEAKDEIAKYISGETRQLVDTAVDEGDWAVVDISEDINLMRLDAHRKLMRDIDEALRKIREGTYGVCEECGEEISEKRLIILPTATLCVSCKETREQFEAVSREEPD